MAVGDIGTGVIDSLSIGNPGSGSSRGDVCHATGDFFCASWFNPTGTVLTLETFSVSTTGTIPCASQDTIDVPTTTTTWSSLVKVADGIVALIYDAGDTGTQRKTVATYSIDACGNFGACDPVDTTIITTTSGGSGWVNLFKTQHTDTYCLLYATGNLNLTASTVTIDSCGNISALLNTKNLTGAGYRNDSWPFGVWTGVDDYYAFAYTDNASADGFAVIWTIDACGTFGTSVTDTHEFETTSATQIAMDSNDNGTLILVYTRSGAADVKTLTVDACGVLANGTKIDIGGSNEFSIVRIDEVDKNMWFTATSVNTFKTYTIDACDVPSQQDTLVDAVVTSAHRAVVHPGVDGASGILVGVGWDGVATEFIAWSVAVHVVLPVVGGVSPQFMGAGSVVKLWKVFYP